MRAPSRDSDADDRIPVSDSTVFVRIDSLLPSDSPRIDGTSESHVRSLAEAESLFPPILVHRATMRVIDDAYRAASLPLR